MAREFTRTDRLAEQVQRELARMLLTETDDPRLHGLLVSGVKVSRDLAHAKVFVTVGRAADGSSDDDDAVLGAIARASGFLRRGLAARLRIRAVPALHFELDKTLDEVDRIEGLLAEARRRK